MKLRNQAIVRHVDGGNTCSSTLMRATYVPTNTYFMLHETAAMYYKYGPTWAF